MIFTCGEICSVEEWSSDQSISKEDCVAVVWQVATTHNPVSKHQLHHKSWIRGALLAGTVGSLISWSTRQEELQPTIRSILHDSEGWWKPNCSL